MFDDASKGVFWRDKEIVAITSEFVRYRTFICIWYGFFDRTNFIFKLFWVDISSNSCGGSEDRIRTSTFCVGCFTARAENNGRSCSLWKTRHSITSGKSHRVTGVLELSHIGVAKDLK